MKVAYIRVSSKDQNEIRQMEAMQNKGIEQFFVEKVSGKDMNRPELQKMLDFVRNGDTVYIHEFARLGRSTEDLLHIMKELDAKGVQLISNKEQFDTHTPQGKLMVTMLSAIAEFERDLIRERQAEGIRIAKEQGKFKGGKPKVMNRSQLERMKSDLEAKRTTKKRAAELLGVSRPTLDKWLSEV